MTALDAFQLVVSGSGKKITQISDSRKGPICLISFAKQNVWIHLDAQVSLVLPFFLTSLLEEKKVDCDLVKSLNPLISPKNHRLTIISRKNGWPGADKGRRIIAQYFIEKKDNLRECPDMNPFSFTMDFHYFISKVSILPFHGFPQIFAIWHELIINKLLLYIGGGLNVFDNKYQNDDRHDVEG